MADSLYNYQAFGLTIVSEILLPELLPVKLMPGADVKIRFDNVVNFSGIPTRIGARYQYKPGQFLYRVDNIAKYLVVGGREIIIEEYPGAEEKSVRTFLLGSVFAALLHQRDILPLHGSSIRVNGKCVIFSGLSGSGKSTTARAFIKRGYMMQADDVSAISCNDEGYPIVYPEYPRLKLWKDVLKREGENPDSFDRVRRVLEKFSVPTTNRFNHEPLALEKIYILTPHNKSDIHMSPVKGMAKFNRIKQLIYRHKFTRGMDTEVFHFNTATQICNSVPITLVHRPKQPYLLEELADLLEEDFNNADKGA